MPNLYLNYNDPAGLDLNQHVALAVYANYVNNEWKYLTLEDLGFEGITYDFNLLKTIQLALTVLLQTSNGSFSSTKASLA